MRESPEPIHEQILDQRLLKRGQQVLVAVSGGLDSVVLLHALHQLSAKFRWQLTVAHVNHGLRGRSSDADERFVKKLAADLGLPVTARRVPVRRVARDQQISLEMAGRDLRHDCLVRMARECGIRTIALAHHADDQVELFFLRLLRGSGTDGLGGMKARSASPADGGLELVRPLLGTPKSSLRDYARRHRLKYREDASNAQLEFQRNRVRHELLPLLKKNYQPALEVVIRRLMEIVTAEADCLSNKASKWVAGQARSGRRSSDSRSGFDELPVALQRRCLQLQLRALHAPVSFELVENLRLEPDRPQSAPGPVGKPSRSLVRDTRGLVREAALTVSKFSDAIRQLDLEGPTTTATFARLSLRWVQRPDSNARPELRRPRSKWHQESFDADQVGATITLRHWRPGDRFRPLGMPSPVKLQDLFVNQKIPRQRRHELVVATTSSEEIFWVEGLRMAENFKLTPATRRRFMWQWRRI